jgi:hypothetical protein
VVHFEKSTHFLSLDETVANLKKIPTSFVRKNIISIRENIDAPIISPIHPPSVAEMKKLHLKITKNMRNA